jgi:hypothetical protein
MTRIRSFPDDVEGQLLGGPGRQRGNRLRYPVGTVFAAEGKRRAETKPGTPHKTHHAAIRPAHGREGSHEHADPHRPRRERNRDADFRIGREEAAGAAGRRQPVFRALGPLLQELAPRDHAVAGKTWVLESVPGEIPDPHAQHPLPRGVSLDSFGVERDRRPFLPRCSQREDENDTENNGHSRQKDQSCPAGVHWP